MEPFPHRHSNSCNNLYNQSYGHREEQRTHRYVRRHLDDSSSACSEGRFMNGSNRDQAPSIHVCKSRTYDEDCSERSFQLGVDPIERDWGDSLSRDYRGTSLNLGSLHSVEGSLLSESHHSNATYRPRTMDESSYLDCGEPTNCSQRRLHSDSDFCKGADSYGSPHTATTATASTRSSIADRSWESRRSSGASRLPPPRPYPQADHSSYLRASFTNRYGNNLDQQARASRPDRQQAQHQHRPTATPYHNIPSGSGGPSTIQSDPHYRRSSNVSSSGSSVCSRSAPARRTPLPREPSVYRPDSWCHSSNSLRTFEYRRRYTDDLRRRQSAAIVGHQVLPPEHMDRIFGEHRQHYSCPQMERSVTNLTEGARNTPADAAVMVHIAPGIEEPLRGTKETYQAVAKDFHANVTCLGCSTELCCIADVLYIVCPGCKVISPLEGCLFEGKEIRRRGLGLGFTYESLFQIQVEIMKERKNRN